MPISKLGRLRPENCIFFLCDIQESFVQVIRGFSSIQAVAERMVNAGDLLSVPVIATEQYPKGLGHTIEALRKPNVQIIEKTQFSMVVPDVDALLKTEAHQQRNSVCLFGLETHVCVQQTALDLLAKGYQVHVLADGVSSRTLKDRKFAIERMRTAGAHVTTSESVLFELLGDAKHPQFKAVSRMVRDIIPDPSEA